tara:strand:+ start:4854 stop:5594 length:741 start_codon:yes stop_codon:yes gene_type:complete
MAAVNPDYIKGVKDYFFSGTNVNVSAVSSMGDGIAFDCNSIQFSYENPRSPLYGYNSNIAPTKMRGTSLIQGSIDLNFRGSDPFAMLISQDYPRSWNEELPFYDLEVEPQIVTGGQVQVLSFNDAFKEARRRLGPGRTFRFKDKIYRTDWASEIGSRSEVSWEQNLNSTRIDMQIKFTRKLSAEVKGFVPNTEPRYDGWWYSDNVPADVGLVLEDIQITSKSHTVTPMPDNVIETYQFIARKLIST